MPGFRKFMRRKEKVTTVRFPGQWYSTILFIDRMFAPNDAIRKIEGTLVGLGYLAVVLGITSYVRIISEHNTIHWERFIVLVLFAAPALMYQIVQRDNLAPFVRQVLAYALFTAVIAVCGWFAYDVGFNPELSPLWDKIARLGLFLMFAGINTWSLAAAMYYLDLTLYLRNKT